MLVWGRPSSLDGLTDDPQSWILPCNAQHIPSSNSSAGTVTTYLNSYDININNGFAVTIQSTFTSTYINDNDTYSSTSTTMHVLQASVHVNYHVLNQNIYVNYFKIYLFREYNLKCYNICYAFLQSDLFRIPKVNIRLYSILLLVLQYLNQM